ncbi:SE1561 family protein [Thalassobacillus pellis]|uniref:SE1561 family protein n=1 Tax=Thalassobacillus pellis TaxID=748008 RepID=UPI00195F7161|nr:SE1561 family protein [Thalassobacillus pellis]MBM7551868.1 hypothetical protein [Thalassobacillus pellis]
MGKASESPSGQFHYIKNRIKMLNQVIESMDENSVGRDDFRRLLEMVEQLQIKMERFQMDWEDSASYKKGKGRK